MAIVHGQGGAVCRFPQLAKRASGLNCKETGMKRRLVPGLTKFRLGAALAALTVAVLVPQVTWGAERVVLIEEFSSTG